LATGGSFDPPELRTSPTRADRLAVRQAFHAALDPQNKPIEEMGDERAIIHQAGLQHLRLRGFYAYFLPILLSVQLAVADVVFILYADLGVHWRLSEPLVGAWLGAAVIQVVGVVAVVTKYLFSGHSASEAVRR
jgi:hypothetical protein